MTDIQSATIDWQTDELGNITPISTMFGDVYFSKTGGLDESRYVFLEGNQLSARFAKLQAGQVFSIIETGFGTGLNFLATCLLWQQTNPKARLHFVSTEKFPLSHSDLATALSVWQNNVMTPWIEQLLAQYPLALAGCHRLHFGSITLDLWFGDALDSLKQMHAQADAWFLDGFAPSKNSELWTPPIFDSIKHLSKPDATLATFTSAGFVKRELIRIGMCVQKIKGFGRKREMLTAHFDGQAMSHRIPQTAVVIGAGVSGLFVAHALAQRGISVKLLDKASPIAGASGNPRALLAPKLTVKAAASEHLPTLSFLYAERIYRIFNQHSGQAIFAQTGMVDFLLPTKKTHAQLTQLIKDYPSELIQEIDAIHSDFSHHPITTFIAKAGLIDPQQLAHWVLSNPRIDFEVFDVTKIQEQDTQMLIFGKDKHLTCDVAVICAGFESHTLHAQLFNPRKIRGQVSWLDISHQDTAMFAQLATPIKYDGYCTAFNTNTNHPTFLMGASFVRNLTDTTIKDTEHQFNVDKFTSALPTIAAKLNINPSTLHGRASIRAQTPDYHPLVGRVGTHSHLYTLYGMGSKGFGFAPLCSEVLAGLICNEPLPIPNTLLQKIYPNRPRLQTPIDQDA